MRKPRRKFTDNWCLTQEHIELGIDALPWLLLLALLFAAMSGCSSQATESAPLPPNGISAAEEAAAEPPECEVVNTVPLGPGYEPNVVGSQYGFLITWEPSDNDADVRMQPFSADARPLAAASTLPFSKYGTRTAFAGLNGDYLLLTSTDFLNVAIKVLHRVAFDGAIIASTINTEIASGAVIGGKEMTARVERRVITADGAEETRYLLARVCGDGLCDDRLARLNNDRYAWSRGLAATADTTAFGVMRSSPDLRLRQLVLMIENSETLREAVIQTDYGFPQMRIEKVFGVRGVYVVQWSDNRNEIRRHRLTRVDPDGTVGRTADIPWAYGSDATDQGFVLATSDTDGVRFRYLDWLARELLSIPVSEYDTGLDHRPRLAVSGGTIALVFGQKNAPEAPPELSAAFIACN